MTGITLHYYSVRYYVSQLQTGTWVSSKMRKIVTISFFLLVISRSSNGQIEDSIGEVIDFSVPEKYDDWEADINNDIWNEEDPTISENNSPQFALQRICTDYNLIYNGQLIDCEDLKISQKWLDSTSNHHLIRREASEDNLEGSGDDFVTEETESDSAPFRPQSLDLEETKVVATNEVQTEKSQTTGPAAQYDELTQTRVEESSNVEPSESKQPIHEVESVQSSVVSLQENSTSLPSKDNVQSVGAETIPVAVNEEEKHEQTVLPSEDKPQTVEDFQQEKSDSNSSPFKTQSLHDPVDIPKEAINVSATDVPKQEETNEKPNLEEKNDEAENEIPKNEDTKIEAPTETVEKELPVNETSKPQETKEISTETPKEVAQTGVIEKEVFGNETFEPKETKEVSPEPSVETPIKDDKTESNETPKEVAQTETVEKEVSGNETSKPKETKEVSPESNVEKSIKDDKTELSETPVNVEESNDKKEGQQEELNPLQSGIAIFKTNANIGETDKQLAKSKSNESIKSNATDAEEPKSGASESTETSKKNNTLLFIIFGAVLVVGAAAFGYNFYKKRQNRIAANRATENGTSKTDPEEGRELKPLMKLPEENNTVEYKDEKNSV